MIIYYNTYIYNYMYTYIYMYVYGHLSSVGRSGISGSMLQFLALDATDLLFLFYLLYPIGFS